VTLKASTGDYKSSNEDGVRNEVGRTTQRIQLRHQWDTTQAIRLIHGNGGSRHADNDQETWMRRQFLIHDKPAYRIMLGEDLYSDDQRVICVSIAELRDHFPEDGHAALEPLLQHGNPDVRGRAAFAMLTLSYEQFSPRSQYAKTLTLATQAEAPLPWAVIEALASDPQTFIPPGRYWFHGHARGKAMELLAAPLCPEGLRWSKDRVREQLDRPDETDGRMVYALMQELRLSEQEMLPYWRRCLSDPLTRGTTQAIEALTKLNDVESLPRMRACLTELRAGCNKHLSWEADAEAQYPWIDAYDLDRLDKGIQAIPSP
jgi:hypothetical protein